ncbi:hypothetical protein NM208_g3851 [Fusarium decemcellulare]|uniref:Uncharacterized protein n=1 Tax=Fusarium decemcellulare TaxID=57161 RepID=A0ACC1SMV4_9HYPO|nr:hypothetical protein NM208_g3851 [Fusarium decemcellulare]
MPLLYIQDMLQASQPTTITQHHGVNMIDKKILVLGSGMVAKPCGVLDVVRSAIKGNTNVVTTSYVSPAIRELDAAAKEAGITILNEVGVDPGVDHLYAIKTISEVHDKGGRVLEFYSYCGGLPAPEASNNPLRFKFSWSPRGVLISQQNSATFLRDGEVINISNKELMSKAVPYHVLDGYSFLAYPNRDSVPFRKAYGIPEAHTVIRGSLRYEGNPALAQIQQQATGTSSPAEVDLIVKVDELCTFSSPEERDSILSGLKWMGLFSDQAPIIHGNLLDTLSAQLEKLYSFQSGSRIRLPPPSSFSENLTATQPCQSRLESCGIATQMLLDGYPALKKPGVLAPYSREICDPIRSRVEAEGIKLVEKMV